MGNNCEWECGEIRALINCEDWKMAQSLWRSMVGWSPKNQQPYFQGKLGGKCCGYREASAAQCHWRDLNGDIHRSTGNLGVCVQWAEILCEESLGDGRCDGCTQCEQVQCRTTVRVEMLLDCSVEMTHLILVCHCVYTGEVKVHGIIHPTFFLRHSIWVSPWYLWVDNAWWYHGLHFRDR